MIRALVPFSAAALLAACANEAPPPAATAPARAAPAPAAAPVAPVTRFDGRYVGVLALQPDRTRKARVRAEAAAAATANRAKHGRTAAERERDEAAEARRRALLDGAKLEDAPGAPGRHGGEG